jgi:iron complex outermembrane receptor protein
MTRSRAIVLHRVAGATLVWLACAAAALAADPEPAATVIVTASPREQRVLDAPFAISVVDAATIRHAGPMINLSEALAQVPGLVVNNRNNYAQDLQISSRGYGARSTFGVRGLRLYTDGIPATMPDGQGQVAHFDLAGAQRIEVLRGPFSVLYGNSSGGVISVFSAPVRQSQVEAGGDVGSFGLRQGRVAVASKLGAGLDLSASGSVMNIEGFRPQSAADRVLGNLRLAWRDERDRVVALLSTHHQSAQDPLGLKPADFAVDPYQTDPAATLFNTRKTVQQTQVGLNWRHQVGADLLQSTSVTAYGGVRDVTQWQSITVAAQLPPTSGGGVVAFNRDYGGVEAHADLRLGPADVVAGVDVETQIDQRRGYENFSGSGADRVLGVTGKLRRDETNRATSTDAYGQASLPLAPTLVAVGGLRAGRTEMSTSDHYVVLPGNKDDSGALAYDYVNPVLGLRWTLDPGWMLHGSIARGFESPTLTELAYRPDGGGGFNTDLKPQHSRQFELGTKWRASGASVDAVVFVTETSDEIGVLSNTGGRATYQNVGRTRRQGAEAAATWQAMPQLRLQASATLLQARYLDDFQTCAAAGCPSAANPKVPVAAGNRIAGTQRGSAWAEAAWRPALVPGELALEWRASAPTAANDTNLVFSPGYALFNLRWSYRLALGAHDALDLLARIDNVADRAYVGSVIVNDGNGRFFETGAPRAFLATVRWQHPFEGP